MPTVVVSWMGRFPNRATQQELCTCLLPIALASHLMYCDFFGVQVEPRLYDGSQQHSVALLSKRVLGELPLPVGLQPAGKNLFLIQDVSFYGLEFVLFDPRRFNSPLMMAHNYDISFVFLRSDIPDLDGLMVEVIRISDDNLLKSSADILLRVPELDLRYYLEHWMNDLLGWVKRFFLPDLFYWAWSNNPGASGYDKFDPGDRKARDEILLYLREVFVAEAEDWKSASIAHREKTDANVTSTEWLEREDELFNKLAQQEKRFRNHGT
jgi:hypothetical protein